MISTTPADMYADANILKNMATRDAISYCVKIEKEMTPVSLKSSEAVTWGPRAHAEFVFRRLDKNDPDFKRPSMASPSVVVIEGR